MRNNECSGKLLFKANKTEMLDNKRKRMNGKNLMVRYF